MEALVIEFAKKYGMEKAIEYFGLDKQKQNPKYTFGMPFTNTKISFDPIQSLGKFALNKVMSGGMSGIMGPAALLGGALFLGNAFNPLNPNAKNYSPNLRGQIDYLSGKDNFIGTHPTTGLTVYGPGSVLAGKGVTSMFGTNNYQTALDNYIDYFENRIAKGKPINEEKYEQAKKEKKDFFEYRADIRDKAKTKSSQPSFKGPTGKDIHGGGGGNNKNNGSSKSNNGSKSGGFSSSERGASLHGAKGGLARYYRGGIASL